MYMCDTVKLTVDVGVPSAVSNDDISIGRSRVSKLEKDSRLDPVTESPWISQN